MPLPTGGKENRKPLVAFSFKLCAAKTDSEGRPGTPVFEHCVFRGSWRRRCRACWPPGSSKGFQKRRGCRWPSTMSARFHGYEQKYFKGLIQRYATQSSRAVQLRAQSCRHWRGGGGFLAGNGVRGSAVALAVASHHGSCKRSYPADDAEVNGGPGTLGGGAPQALWGAGALFQQPSGA